MTMHYERLFATTSTDKYTLYFSDDLDPTNWNENITEGGFIQMLDERGELLKVISFWDTFTFSRTRNKSCNCVCRSNAVCGNSSFYCKR